MTFITFLPMKFHWKLYPCFWGNCFSYFEFLAMFQNYIKSYYDGNLSESTAGRISRHFLSLLEVPVLSISIRFIRRWGMGSESKWSSAKRTEKLEPINLLDSSHVTLERGREREREVVESKSQICIRCCFNGTPHLQLFMKHSLQFWNCCFFWKRW